MDHVMDVNICNQNSVSDMEIVLSEYYEADLLKVEPRRGNIGRNKLKTYNQFKKDLQIILNKRHCSA